MKLIAQNPIFIVAWTRIAILFLSRNENWTYEEAKAEVALIKERIGVDGYVAGANGGKFENDAYITMLRRGSKKPLNRAKRVEVALSLNNAINHALFEYEENVK